MLKWLVTGREGGEAVLGSISSQPRSVSVNNTDDPLAAAVGCNSDNNNYNLYKVNRLVIMEIRLGELPQRKLTSCPLISFHILLRRLEIPWKQIHHFSIPPRIFINKIIWIGISQGIFPQCHSNDGGNVSDQGR